jgi:hypothetical protein
MVIEGRKTKMEEKVEEREWINRRGGEEGEKE